MCLLMIPAAFAIDVLCLPIIPFVWIVGALGKAISKMKGRGKG